MQKIIDYYNSTDISQSMLKDFLIHPMFFKLKHFDKIIKKDKKSYFELGSLVDCLVLTPDWFDKIYAIYLGDITPQIKILCEYIINEEIDYSSYDVIFDTVKKLNIFNTIKKIDTIKKKLEEENFENYINFYSDNKGKVIITQEFYLKAFEIASSLLNNDFTKEYFHTGEGIEILTSYPIYWKHHDYNHNHGFTTNCKSLIDMIRIDHNNHTIALFDLKTTGESTSMFSKSIMKYRYDFQAAYYMAAVKWWINNSRLELKDYEIKQEFSFIVESTTTIGSPLIYKLTPHTINIGKYGDMFTERNVIKTIPGFNETIENLNWHIIEEKWYYTREQYENKGIVTYF